MGNSIIGVVKYLLFGVVVAIGGIFFSALCGNFFNGLRDYGSAVVFGIGLYLCIVVVTYTGLILNRLESEKSKGEDTKQSNK